MDESAFVGLRYFETFDYVVLTLAALLLAFSGPLVRSTAAQSNRQAKLLLLRAITAPLLVLYLTALFFQIPHLREISQSGITLLVWWIAGHVLQTWIVARFGRRRDVDGETLIGASYHSEVFSLIAFFFAGIAVVVVLLNIWGLTSWLQATGVIGALLLIVVATKDAWAADVIAGLIMLYNRDLDPGTVIEVRGGPLAIVLRTSLTQTELRELSRLNRVVLPNAQLRQAGFEVFGSAGTTCRDYVEFNIGYDTSSAVVEKFLHAVWDAACCAEKALGAEQPINILLVEAGDHAIRWRLSYPVTHVYRLQRCRFALNRAAFDLQDQFELTLATPLTHTVAAGDITAP